jgi:hypothetical protein
MGTQVPHGRHRPSRVGNHHCDDIAVFRPEVFDHHVDVHDLQIGIPEGVLPGRFVVAAEFESLNYARSAPVEEEGLTGNRNGRSLWGAAVLTSSGKRSLYD